MSTRLKEALEAKIAQWVEEESDQDDWAEAWFAPETTERMAAAAYLVFLSSRDGQRFQGREEGTVERT